MDAIERANIYKAMGDLNRLQIIEMLKGGDKCTTDILECIPISQSTLSHHLKILTEADLIQTIRGGKNLYYTLNRETITKCRDILGDLIGPVPSAGEGDGEKARAMVTISKAFNEMMRYMCILNIADDTYRVVEKLGEGDFEIGETVANARDNMRRSIEYISGNDMKEQCRNFIDLSTLSERLGGEDGKEHISLEFESPSLGWIRISFISAGFDIRGNLSEAVYVIQDISEEKNNEFNYYTQLADSLLHEQNLNRAKKEFIAKLGHNLRNSLQGITGLVDVMHRVYDEPDRVIECTDKVKASVNNLQAYIKDLSEMSEIECGEVRFIDSPNNIREMIQDVDAVAEPIAKNAGVTIAYVEDGEIRHPHVICSGGYIRQLFRMLLNRAIADCKSGGRVVFTIKEQDMFGERASFLVTIEDDGLGTYAKDLEGKFDLAYYMSEDIDREVAMREDELPMCKKIVEMLGGAITVVSEPDEGTRVSMLLPFVIDDSGAKMREELLRNLQVAGKQVLLVEDDELNVEVTKYLLEDAEVAVTVANNGKEAVEIYENSPKNHFDVILMDIIMPMMDGLEATRAIRGLAREDASKVPIIAMSANAMNEDVKKSLDAGMNLHMTKPLEIRKLLTTIDGLAKESYKNG